MRAAAHEAVVGDPDRLDPLRTAAADERLQAALEWADLAVRRRPPLGIQVEDAAAAHLVHEPAEVAGGRSPVSPPGGLEPLASELRASERLPEEVAVLATVEIPGPPRLRRARALQPGG